jgi:hypothetical protein
MDGGLTECFRFTYSLNAYLIKAYFMRNRPPAVFAPGQAIRTSRLFYWHKGIATDQWLNGEQLVISCSGRAGKVVVEPMGVFTAGMRAEAMQQLSTVSREIVLYQARQMLGKEYSLVDFNCEHFLYQAFGLAPQSPQLAGLLGLVAGVALLRAM